MKVSTEIDNNFGYEKITQLVDNIPLILEVGAGYELYVSGVIIVTRQRPKPFLRPPMPLPTKLWREWNHSIFT